jgi:signal transduction histidine kinase
LTKLADDLLLLARSETGELMLERQVVKLDMVCLDMVEHVRPLAQERGLTLQFSTGDEPLMVLGDARRLKQLILNLLDNAIKYSPPGGQIQVQVARQDSFAAVDVADSGYGIPAEDLPHIFDRFYRRRQKLDDQAAGFGLGLAICKWIVEAHGGTITVESEPDQGTRFRFQIPVLKNT